MKDQFVPYEYAKMMKELGYNERCNTFYYDSKSGVEKTDIRNSEMKEKCCQAPLYQQAEEWLWKKHKIQIRISEDYTGRLFRTATYWKNNIVTEVSEAFDSPITAHREGILQAIVHIYKNK